MKRPSPYVLAAALLLFTLAGCSSSNKISVTTTDFNFSPQEWTVNAGQQIEVTLTNKGALNHEWVLIKAGEAVTPPFDGDDESKVVWEIEAGPGETVTGTFTAPGQPGTYTVVCGVLGHLEAGMTGSLVVE
jgi:plastocyanin